MCTKYNVCRNKNYDFVDEAYSSIYPNLHKYPATMLPQIGIKILEEIDVTNGILLDPYCGSGSSFSSALNFKFNKVIGFDLNPLAILISKAKLTISDPEKLYKNLQYLKNSIYEAAKTDFNSIKYSIPECKNIDFWFSADIKIRLAVIQYFIKMLTSDDLLFKLALSETIRDCSYTRNGEFKLYKMKEIDILKFNPDVFSLFLKKCERNIDYYISSYFPNLKKINFTLYNSALNLGNIEDKIDVVLTSPPYGDSKTTVAYGQFSNFSNEWFGHRDARSIDKHLMGGQNKKKLYTSGHIAKYINEISNIDNKRALEISSFYFDLEQSIIDVSKTIKDNGYSIYVVGNRTVKGVTLPSDQFIAEQFENNNFQHIKTYKRAISSKVMPSRNSPTNKVGKTATTMNYEYIIVSRKKRA